MKKNSNITPFGFETLQERSTLLLVVQWFPWIRSFLFRAASFDSPNRALIIKNK